MVPARQGNGPPSQGPEEKACQKNGSQDLQQSYIPTRVSDHPHSTPFVQSRCPGGFVFKLPHHPGMDGENEMSEPGPSLFMGLMANVTDVHAGTPASTLEGGS